MTTEITASTLRKWLYDGDELALLDVREPGQIVLGHILFSAPLPWSRFEADLGRLVPNPSVRMVLCDAGDGIALRAAQQAAMLGYSNVSILQGGVKSWAAAGHTLYEGVNVPSKAFGELVEHVADTPRMDAMSVARLAGAVDHIIVDGRPSDEFRKMSIPNATCCPNGELALRIRELAPDPETTIIVNCAGRTRSIIGAQTLIDFGVPNPTYAMENGTQGWVLAGLELDRGKDSQLPGMPEALDGPRSEAAEMAARFGVEAVSGKTLQAWHADESRTTCVLDVRSAEERDRDPDARKALLDSHRVVHAPGGQLVQATDQWIAVRNARIVLLDTEDVRSKVTASWLRRLGHNAYTLIGGVDALADLSAPSRTRAWQATPVPSITAAAAVTELEKSDAMIIDLRSSAAYRQGHVAGSTWSIRPRLPDNTGDRPVFLISDDPDVAALAAADLTGSGTTRVAIVDGGFEACRAAGATIVTAASTPEDVERIDFLSFTHGRHDGNEQASRQYLAWEIALVDQLDSDERAVFRI